MKDIAKWNPRNWFRDEGGGRLPPSVYGGTPLLNVHREIDRLFDDMFAHFANPLPRAFEGFEGGMLRPDVDIKERKKDYKITVEVPGVDEDDIRLELSDHALTISGEKKHEKEESGERYHSMERSYGSFRRVLSLPEDATEEGIEANFRKGLLTITVPRQEQLKPKDGTKQIEIRRG